MSASVAASVVGVAVGVNSLTNGGVSSMLGFGGGKTAGGGNPNTAAGAQQAVDPFASHRAALGDQYASALSQGGTVDPTSMPGYSQWMSGVLNPALEAVEGQMSTKGLAGSSAANVNMTKTAEQGYYGFMTDYMNRLATGSGATAGPAAGGQAAMTGGAAGDQQFMQGVGGVIQGAAGLYNRGGTGGYTTSNTYNPDPSYSDPSLNSGYDYGMMPGH